MNQHANILHWGSTDLTVHQMNVFSSLKRFSLYAYHVPDFLSNSGGNHVRFSSFFTYMFYQYAKNSSFHLCNMVLYVLCNVKGLSSMTILKIQ